MCIRDRVDADELLGALDLLLDQAVAGQDERPLGLAAALPDALQTQEIVGRFLNGRAKPLSLRPGVLQGRPGGAQVGDILLGQPQNGRGLPGSQLVDDERQVEVGVDGLVGQGNAFRADEVELALAAAREEIDDALVGGVQVVGRGRVEGRGQFVGQQLGAAAQLPDVLVDGGVGVAQRLAVDADSLRVAAHKGQFFAAIAQQLAEPGRLVVDLRQPLVEFPEGGVVDGVERLLQQRRCATVVELGDLIAQPFDAAGGFDGVVLRLA